MSEFKVYHPAVNFMYFTAVIIFSMLLMHPACLIISLLCGFAYSVMLRGKKALKFNLIVLLPLIITSALINPAFNHEGVTILTYLPSGNPLTLESVIYGAAAALMLGAVICWFSCYNEIMTSDKFIYLFGRVIPSLSLVLSMALRFVPRFSEQIRIISRSQKCIGRDVSNGGIIQRARHGITILSIMITWALENAVDTADSMKSRGYGLPNRSAFSIFSFERRDRNAVLYIALVCLYITVGVKEMYFNYFPMLRTAQISAYSVSVFVAYILLCVMPILIEVTEVIRWKYIRSKI